MAEDRADALDVAAAIIESTDVDQMKLHKLLYFVQAGSLAWFDKPAFEEEIEAWIYGPVTRRVAGHYKDFDGDPIPEPVAGDAKNLDSRTAWLVKRVVSEFANRSGPDLARVTKSPDGPWRQVRADLPDEEPSNREIPVSLIRDYHRELGVFPSEPTKREQELAQRFLDGELDALAELFESVTGVRPTVE